MATEGSKKMVEGSGARRNWPSYENSANCGSQLNNMAPRGIRIDIEGSFAAIGNLLAKQDKLRVVTLVTWYTQHNRT